MLDTLTEKLGTFVIVIFFIIIIALIMALPTMWLWNWLMPIIFGLTKITFWQALGLNILGSLLFKSTSTSSK